MRILLIVFCISLSSCLFEPLERKNGYYVDAGQNDFHPNTPDAVFDNELHFSATLSQNTAYELKELLKGTNQVNKLFGFSDCGHDHLTDSARIGWMYSNGQMLIIPFAHVHGKEVFDIAHPLGVVQLGRSYSYRIEIVGNQYRYSFKNDSNQWITQMGPRGCQGTTVAKYLAMPWFGGQSPAPHRMDITVVLDD